MQAMQVNKWIDDEPVSPLLSAGFPSPEYISLVILALRWCKTCGRILIVEARWRTKLFVWR